MTASSGKVVKFNEDQCSLIRAIAISNYYEQILDLTVEPFEADLYYYLVGCAVSNHNTKGKALADDLFKNLFKEDYAKLQHIWNKDLPK